MPRRILIVLTFFLLSYSPISAQSISFENYSTRDGLLSEEVYNIYQDRDGYIWCFTNYGAMKYNGREFRQVLLNLPFSESFVYTMFENERGEKWVANSKANIYKIIHDSAFIIKGIEKLSEGFRKQVHEILQIVSDDSSNLYIRTKQTNYKLTLKNGRYQASNLNEPTSESVNYEILELDKEVFPVFKYNRPEKLYSNFFDIDSLGLKINSVSNDKVIKIPSKSLTGPRHVKKLNGKIYLCLYDKIIKIAQNGFVSTIPVNQFILNFTIDKNGHLWVATYNNGLLEFDGKDSLVNHYFSGVTVNDVLADNQNGLWASTPGSGLFHSLNINDKYFGNGHPLQESISFIKEIRGNLYIGTNKGFVYRKLKNNGRLEPFYRHNTSVNNIYVFGDQMMIPATYEILILDTNGTLKHKINVSNVSQIISMHDTLLFAHRKGIGLIHKNKHIRRVDLNAKTFSIIRGANSLLIATDNGVFEPKAEIKKLINSSKDSSAIIQGELIQPSYLKRTAGAVVTNIVKDKKHRLWFTSNGSGVFVLSIGNQISQYTIEEGLPTNIINHIAFDDNGAIFLSTNKGLFISEQKSIEGANWKRIYPGDVRKVVLFNSEIYLMTRRGVVVLDRKALNESNNVSFKLVSIFANAEAIDSSALSSLTNWQNNLEFQFDILSLREPKQSIRYSLSGAASDSGLSNNSTVMLQNLKFGHYHLEVWPDMPNGRSRLKVYDFYIKPSFWETKTFYAILSVITGLILIFSTYLGFRIYKKRADKRNAAEKLLLEYKLIALKAQVNPHFLSNCLAALQNLVLADKLEKAATYIAKFGLLVRQILNFSNRSLISLNEELNVASLYMDLERLRFENKFNYKIQVADDLIAEEIFVPALILNPIIENAIWHGLLPLGNQRIAHLKIQVKKELNTLLLIIEDNGVGRQHRQHPGNTRESKGINLTKQRLANINDLYSTSEAKLSYSEITGAAGENNGTRVIISLPINLSSAKNE